MAIIGRICTLEENVAGNPRASQWTLGDIDSHDILPNGFFIGYGGVNVHWPGGGLRPRYILWRHSPTLYAIFCGNNATRIAFLEEAPRNGMRGRVYCEQETHDWRVFRATGWDNTDPENPVWMQERLVTLPIQPPPISTISESTPWTPGAYEIWELLPSIAGTIAGFDLPAYTSAYSDEVNGDEIDD